MYESDPQLKSKSKQSNVTPHVRKFYLLTVNIKCLYRLQNKGLGLNEQS